jgi:hypothetical protein
MGSLYNGTKRMTDYDAVKTTETSIPAIKEAEEQLFTGN